MSKPAQSKQEAIRAQAATEWLLRLHEDALSEAQMSEWIEWCDSDPKNLQTFEQLQCLWRAAAEHPPDRQLRAQLMRSEHLHGPFTPRPWLALAAALVVASVVGLLLADKFTARSPGASRARLIARVDSVQTPLATNQRATLPDGSNVELGARSVLDVNFAGAQRKLRLRNGQAYFQVKHDSVHPFVVEAGGVQIVAVGTAFDVRRGGAEVAVTVQEGTVEVLDTLASSKPMSATAGYQLVIDTTTGKSRQSIVDPAVALAWRSGRLEFTGDSLDVVIASMNRYSQHPIRLADPALGKLVFTGTVFVDSVDASLDAMQQVFPIELHRVGHEVVLVNRAD